MVLPAFPLREVIHIPTGKSLALARDSSLNIYILIWRDKNKRYLDQLNLPSYTKRDGALKIFNSYLWMCDEEDLIHVK